MGPWGFRTFEDELACDWLEDLFDSDPILFFRHCLDLQAVDYVEYLAGIGVICTSEMLHAICDRPRDGLPAAAHAWLQRHRRLEVVDLLPDAISGLGRVLGPESELRERWQDHDQWGEQWNRCNRDLLRRMESDFRSACSGPEFGRAASRAGRGET